MNQPDYLEHKVLSAALDVTPNQVHYLLRQMRNRELKALADACDLIIRAINGEL